jgi:hypothetical protein
MSAPPLNGGHQLSCDYFRELPTAENSDCAFFARSISTASTPARSGVMRHVMRRVCRHVEMSYVEVIR